MVRLLPGGNVLHLVLTAMGYETSTKLLDRVGFQATFETLTEDSVECGSNADHGWLDWQGCATDLGIYSHWDLQDLIRLKHYRFEGDGGNVPRWITCDADQQDVIQQSGVWSFLDGRYLDSEVIGGSISIHRPHWITDASWLRVCRLLGWRG